VKSRNNLVISLALSGFEVSFLFMGSVTSDFLDLPVFLFHEKKIFCVKIISTKFNHPKRSHEDSLEKTNQNKQRVFRLLFRRKKNQWS